MIVARAAGAPTDEFDAYGMEIVHTNTCPQNYKFTGYERDPETADPNTGLNGLDYSFARLLRLLHFRSEKFLRNEAFPRLDATVYLAP